MKNDYNEGLLSGIITVSSLLCLFFSLYITFSNVNLDNLSITSSGYLLFQNITEQLYNITLAWLHSTLFWVLSVLIFILMFLGIRIYTVYKRRLDWERGNNLY